MPWTPDVTEHIAYGILDGVGDASLGEWTEWVQAFHLRRRLSNTEAELVGPVVDIRGTWEAKKRLNQVRKWLPKGWTE
jgi:hypothetical protein